MLTKQEDLTDNFETLDIQITPKHLDDPGFLQLHNQFESINKEILALEASKVPTTDEHFVELKTHRVRLKDTIYQQLKEWEQEER